MLARKNRFHGHNSVRIVYRQGRPVRSGFGSLHVRVNDKRHLYRAAVVVSKKVSKSAVVRNRIRRRVYEVLRLQAASFTKPYDLILTVQTDQVATMPPDELEKGVLSLLQQAGVLG